MYIVTEVEDIEAGPSGYIAGRSTKAGQRLHLAVNGCCSHRLYLRACCRVSTSHLPSVFRPCPGMMSFTSVNSTLWTSGGKSAANSLELPWGCSWTTVWKLTPAEIQTRSVYYVYCTHVSVTICRIYSLTTFVLPLYGFTEYCTVALVLFS